METLVGYSAAAFGISISLPQIYKTIKTKKASDLSVAMWILLTLTQVLWFSYAAIRGDFILALNNAVVFVQDILMLYLIHKYRHN